MQPEGLGECAMKRLIDILDKKNFERLITEFGGKRIWIPKQGNIGHRDKVFFVKRNGDIVQLNKRGKSIDELARRFNLSQKRIYEILGEKAAGATRGRTKKCSLYIY
jgi:Mor family transcriptional regulator